MYWYTVSNVTDFVVHEERGKTRRKMSSPFRCLYVLYTFVNNTCHQKLLTRFAKRTLLPAPPATPRRLRAPPKMQTSVVVARVHGRSWPPLPPPPPPPRPKVSRVAARATFTTAQPSVVGFTRAGGSRRGWRDGGRLPPRRIAGRTPRDDDGAPRRGDLARARGGEGAFVGEEAVAPCLVLNLDANGNASTTTRFDLVEWNGVDRRGRVF